MSTKRTPIGRTFTATLLSENDSANEYTQMFTLASGKTALFHLIYVGASELEKNTFVQFETNGRDQTALTKESLKDILQTIHLQQFYPAIGRRHGDAIEILDGSRRRASALIKQVGLNILVTDDEVSVTDARNLAATIQTAKEHNLREQGLRFLKFREAGISQKEIAISENLSEAKVSRAMQAASVPQDMLSLFPVQSELTFPDYKFLLGVKAALADKDIPLERFIEALATLAKDDLSLSSQQAADETKDHLIYLARQVLSEFLNQPAKERVVTQKIWEFDDKDRFARKKIKGRTFSYEFNRLPKELQDKIDAAIRDAIGQHFSQ